MVALNHEFEDEFLNVFGNGTKCNLLRLILVVDLSCLNK